MRGWRTCQSTMAMLQLLIILVAAIETELKSKELCSQCSGCHVRSCPSSEAYPHMTAWDNSLVASALQSDYVPMKDRGVYAVPNTFRDQSENFNSYYGWQSTSGSVSGFHRFSNYMDKCSDGQSFLAVDRHGMLGLRSLSSLGNLGQADWKSYSPPEKYNHREFRFWLNRSAGKCLTVFEGRKQKRTVGVAKCELDGSDPFQLFAFRYHYHKAFCCCGLHNE